MKKSSIFLLASGLLAGVFTACDTNTPPVEPVPTLTLSADSYSLLLDEENEVRFTVMLDGTEDVTANSRIYDSGGVPLSGAAFSTTEAGRYQFYATLERGGTTLRSNEITVKAGYANDPNFDPAKDIDKNVAFFIITGTWCDPCWPHKVNMNKVAEECGGHMFMLNLHISNDDVIGGHSSMQLKNILNQLSSDGRFGTTTGIPATIVECRKKYPGAMSESVIRGAYNDYISNPVKTGFAVNSTITAGKLDVTVTVGARQDGEYRIGIFLVEDHIIAKQQGYGSNYDHTNVARQMGTESMFGESIGTLTAGKTIEKEFSFDLLPKYNTENLHLLVYTLSKEDGHVIMDNSRKVPAMGYSPYDYVED